MVLCAARPLEATEPAAELTLAAREAPREAAEETASED